MAATPSPFPLITSPPQSLAEVVVNEALAVLAPGAVYGYAYQTSTGLTWGYYGGRWGGFSIAAGTFTLGASTTTYLVVEKATGAHTASTSNTHWNDDTNYVRAYKVVTGASTVTSVEDHRAGPGGTQGGAGGGGGGGGGDAASVTYDPTASGLSATDVQAAIDELAAGGGGGGGAAIAFSAYVGSTDQTFSGAGYRIVALTAEDFDTAGAFDTTTYKFQPTTAGYYQINGTVWVQGAALTSGHCSINKNGATYKYGLYGPAFSGNAISIVSAVVYLNGSSDYLEFFGYSDAAGSAKFLHGSENTHFSGAFLGT